ncbi:MAG: LptE family protein [Candidatus Latescibacterota bacterium]|nr:MAG: LptE family protein [Candidatus Latescibacterota bacterium]
MRFATCILFMLAAAAVGCGYYSTSSRTAKDIQSIAVPFFDNRTPEPNLEIIVTEGIINELVADNTLKVKDEADADAILDGVIVSFQNVPFSFNPDLNAEEYHVVVTVDVTLFSRRLNEPIWGKTTIKGDGSYFADVAEEEGTYDSAVAEALREITDRILNLTVQDW